MGLGSRDRQLCVCVCVCVCVCTRAPEERGGGDLISKQLTEFCETLYQRNSSYRSKYDVSFNFLKSLIITSEIYF